MSQFFCVFWLPRLYHKDLTVLPTAAGKLEEDISDNIGDVDLSVLSQDEIDSLPADQKKSIHHVSVAIDKNYDITIVSKSGRMKEAVSVVLEYVSFSRNGLIQYKLQTSDKKKEEQFIVNAVTVPIYHLIKGFFHTHEYHLQSADSTLEAFTSETQINLQENDNPALIWYLEQYEAKFRAVRNMAFEALNYIEETDKKGEEERFCNYIERHRLLATKCDNALGESLYYDSLLYSRYNRLCTCKRTDDGGGADGKEVCNDACETSLHADAKAGEHCKSLHRCALNTKNAIDGIRQIQRRNKSLFDYKTGEYILANFSSIDAQIRMINAMTDTANKQLIVTNRMVNAAKTQIDATNNLIVKGDKIARVSKNLGWLSAYLGLLSVCLGLLSVYLVFNPQDVEKKSIPLGETSLPMPHLPSSSLQKSAVFNAGDSAVLDINIERIQKTGTFPDEPTAQ